MPPEDYKWNGYLYSPRTVEDLLYYQPPHKITVALRGIMFGIENGNNGALIARLMGHKIGSFLPISATHEKQYYKELRSDMKTSNDSKLSTLVFGEYHPNNPILDLDPEMRIGTLYVHRFELGENIVRSCLPRSQPSEVIPASKYDKMMLENNPN